jgi:dihydroorotate dehydrogenase
MSRCNCRNLVAIKEFEFDGVIASNTTIRKDNLRYSGQQQILQGGYLADLC